MPGNQGVVASDPGCDPTGSAAVPASSCQHRIPNAERLKLDRRIRNQRRALRENWEIVEMRTRGHRRFTASAIRLGTEACDIAGIPRRSGDGIGYLSYHERMRRLKALLAQAIEARSGQTEGLDPKGERNEKCLD